MCGDGDITAMAGGGGGGTDNDQPAPYYHVTPVQYPVPRQQCKNGNRSNQQ